MDWPPRIYPEDVDNARKELVPAYNRAGALEAITFNNTDYVRQIAYNAKGQRVLLAMGNDMMTRYAYDPVMYRLLRIKTEKYTEASNTYTPASGTTRQDSGYAYDLGGNILKITERVTDCGITGTTLGADALDRLFTYDPLKRLLSATGRESDTQSNSNFWEEKPAPGSPNANHVRSYTQSFDYDKAGNILQLGHQATGNSYSRYFRYTTGHNFLEQLDNDGSPAAVYASFTYDANGNQLTINTDRFFEWDAADQLCYFKIDAGGGPSVQAHYLYAGGSRVKKLVRDQQGNTEITVYIDGVYEHRCRKNNSGTVTDDQTQLHVMDGRSRIAGLRLGDDFGDTTPATTYNLEDHLGTSTTRLTDSGTVIDREEYYPFGESSLRTFDKKRYRYVGKELDSESGLYYYGARYYAAWTCRFISVDPLAAKYAHLNPYNYAGNKPIGDLDIDGMQSASESKSANATDSGDKKFDKAANKASKDNPNSNISINVTNINGCVTGSISVDGKTANYTSENGFTDENGASLTIDQEGNLYSPTSILSVMPNPDADVALKVPSSPSLRPTENSRPPTISAEQPQSSNSKEEQPQSYGEDKKSDPQKVAEDVQKGADWADSAAGAANESIKGSSTVRNSLSQGIYEGSKFLKRVTKNWGNSISKWIQDLKPGKLFQGTKNIIPKISKVLGKAAEVLTVATIAWEVLTDTWDAHTIVNAAIFTGLLVVGAVLGPVAALIGGIALAVIWTVGDMDNKIDQNFGRKTHPEWYPDKPLINPTRYSF